MKVLIVSTNLSHPTDAGNRTAIMGQVQILKHLGCDIHFLFVDMALRQADESQMKPEEGRREASLSHRNSCTAMSEDVTMLENPSFCEISKSLSISFDASLTILISSLMCITECKLSKS